MTQTPPTDTQDAPTTRRPGTGCIVFTIVGIFVLLIAGFIANQFLSRSLTISKETTLLTEPLKSEGEMVDYFAAMQREMHPANMATDENGFRLVMRRIRQPMSLARWQFEQTCEKLGLDPSTIDADLTFESPQFFVTTWLESDDFDEAVMARLLPDGLALEDVAPRARKSLIESRLEAPWSDPEMPFMAEWLERNEPALDLLVEAARKPVFCVPLVRENEFELFMERRLPYVNGIRPFTRGLATRANHRIAEGDIDGAIDDLIACKRLGRILRPHAGITDVLIGVGIECDADSIAVAGSRDHPPTREQLLKLADELDRLPPRDADVAAALRESRVEGLDLMQIAARAWEGRCPAGYDPPSEVEAVGGSIGVDWNVAMKRYNWCFDHPDEFLEYLDEDRSDWLALISRAERSRRLGDLFGALMLPADDLFREALHRRACIDRMQRLTVAMLLYECDRGTLPPAYTVDDAGAPLHSWRVLLLPYLGEKERALYDKIRLDEPWDSEHNAAFHSEDLPVFRCPSSAAAAGRASYRVAVGPDMPFQAGEGKKLSDFGPESEDMILLVESLDDCGWMDPRCEMSQEDAERGMASRLGDVFPISSEHPGGASFGLRGGNARFLSDALDDEMFRAMLRGTNEEIDY